MSDLSIITKILESDLDDVNVNWTDENEFTYSEILELLKAS